MSRLFALWQELGREHEAAFGIGLAEQMWRALTGTLAFAWAVIGVLTLAIAGGWL